MFIRIDSSPRSLREWEWGGVKIVSGYGTFSAMQTPCMYHRTVGGRGRGKFSIIGASINQYDIVGYLLINEGTAWQLKVERCRTLKPTWFTQKCKFWYFKNCLYVLSINLCTNCNLTKFVCQRQAKVTGIYACAVMRSLSYPRLSPPYLFTDGWAFASTFASNCNACRLNEYLPTGPLREQAERWLQAPGRSVCCPNDKKRAVEFLFPVEKSSVLSQSLFISLSV